MSGEIVLGTVPQQTLWEDDAHLLMSRGIIRLDGERAAEALQPLVSNSLQNVADRPVLAYVLTDNGAVQADVFVVSHQDGLLVDCSRSQLPALMEMLHPMCETFDATLSDESENWRVFGVLPSQSVFMDGTTLIKYADPRPHMGTRVMRPRSSMESSEWNHENKWIAHCFRLGMLPSTDLLQTISVDPLEANLHALGVIHPDNLGAAAKGLLDRSRDQIKRRILPMRVEPKTETFPTMTGQPVLAGDVEIGTVLGHLGVYALALVNLSEWRSALTDGVMLRCVEEMVSITWPTWCASESEGRGGPLALER